MTLKKIKSYASFAVIVCVLPFVAACSGGDQEGAERRHIANNFSELIVAALDDLLLQDFDKDVLERAKASGRIGQADYDEAFSRFAQCMLISEEPVTLKKFSNGLYRVDTTPLSDGESLDAALSVFTKCQIGTTAVLEAQECFVGANMTIIKGGS